MEGFVSVVEGLGREAKGHVSANHFDAIATSLPDRYINGTSIHNTKISWRACINNMMCNIIYLCVREVVELLTNLCADHLHDFMVCNFDQVCKSLRPQKSVYNAFFIAFLS